MMLLHAVNKTQKTKNPDFGKIITQINELPLLEYKDHLQENEINSMNGHKNQDQ